MRKLLIAGIVIVVVMVGADRVAAVVADRQIASRVQASYHLPSKPSVSVQGFPFLTQVAAGSYHEIDLSTGQLDSSGVQVNDLVAHLMGVHAPVRDLVGANSANITAAQLTGTRTVPLSSVQSRGPQGLQVSQDGRGLPMSVTGSYLVVSVPASACA